MSALLLEFASHNCGYDIGLFNLYQWNPVPNPLQLSHCHPVCVLAIVVDVPYNVWEVKIITRYYKLYSHWLL